MAIAGNCGHAHTNIHTGVHTQRRKKEEKWGGGIIHTRTHMDQVTQKGEGRKAPEMRNEGGREEL